MGLVEASRAWARRIKRDAVTLWFATRHPDTPWFAKALALFVVGYALSPIDLIPDFIPVLGYLDDVILLPTLIWLTVRAIPEPVLHECRGKADAWLAEGKSRPRSRWGAAVIVGLWIALTVAAGWWAVQRWG